MSFSFISKISLYLSFVFIFSCQNTISSLGKKNNNLDIENNDFKFETEDFIDVSLFQIFENNGIDIYTTQL